MAYEDELEALIGPLKRAAIDAYMRKDGWGPFNWDIQDDKYFFTHPNMGGGWSVTTSEVTRPNENGEGGGDYKMRISMAPDPDEEPGKYAGEFDQIRNRIDEALERWKNIPDPTEISEITEFLRQANRTLSLDAVSADGTVTGGGEIGGNINLAMANSSAMSGGMITAFKANFMAQLGKAIAGHHALTIVLGGVVAAEEEIWKGARQTVLDNARNSTEAFKAAAEGGDVDWKVVLQVVGFAVAGAAIFATGGAATALAVGGLGIKILDAAVPAKGKDTEGPSADFDSVMGTFERVLNDLDTAIETEEQILEDNLHTNLTQVRADKSSYDLDRPPIIDIDDDSDLGSPDELRIDPVLTKEVTETYLPNVAAELNTAGVHLNDAVSLSSIWRDSSIGLGTYGPNTYYYEMRYLAYELIKNLQVEIKWSAKSLQLGVEDLQVVDTQEMDALETHAKQVVDLGIGKPGSPYNPWN